MGSFFTNMQVYIGGIDPGGVRGQVVEVLRRWVMAGPYEEVVDPGDADRMIAVGPAGECPWVAVFDDATESQEESKLLELAVQLSKELNTPLVTISVHDSDVLNLNLMSSGELVDAFCNAPEYFEPVPKEEKARVAGNPFMWAPLLVDGASPADLNAVWNSEPVFADEIVEAMAPLVGWNPELSRVGCRYLDEDDVEGVTRLCFRDKNAPRGQEVEHAAGPPCLQWGPYSPNLEFSSAEPFQLQFSGRCTGGRGTGLVVALYGPAIEQGLLVPGEAHALTGHMAGEQWSPAAEAHASVEQETAVDGRAIWVARLPDFPLPAGVASQPPALGRNSMKDMERWMKAQVETEIRVTINGRTGNPGHATFVAGMIPDENRAGSFTISHRVDVVPAPHRPLRIDTLELAGGNQPILRDMAKPGRLFSLMSLDAAPEIVAEAAGDAFERWHRVIAGEHCGKYQVVWTDRSRRLQQKTMELRQFLSGSDWPKWQSSLTQGTFSVTLFKEVHPGSGTDELIALHYRNSGFLIDNPGPIKLERPPVQAVLPQLLLWIDVEDLPPEKILYITDDLREITSEVMAHAGGNTQAFMACWHHPPSRPGEGVTLYELACGIHDGASRRLWCTRYLRGVSHCMWLGPELLQHLGGLEQVRLVAEVVPVGQGVRIEFPVEMELSDIERLLTPLLAGRKEWEAEQA